MDLENFTAAVVSFVREHEDWAVPVVFLVAFGESVCFLSLFWPGTVVLVALTGLLSASGLDIALVWPMIAAAGAGGSLGYAVSYWIGMAFKDSIHKVWPFSARPDLIPRGRRFFETYGAFGVFLGHFFGPVRAVIPVVAGMFAMRQAAFQIANISSAFLWSAGVIAPSYFAVTFKDSVLAFARGHESLVAVLLFLLAAANSVPYAGLFVPTLVFFAGLGALHLFAGGNFWPVWLAGAAGAFAGDVAFYLMGARRHTAFAGPQPGRSPLARTGTARTMIAQWGASAVITSKFQGLRRAEIPPMAGAMEVPPIEFAAASLISALLWAAAFLSPRYVFHLFGW